MAPIITPVSSIVAGKINIKLHVRVINLWTVPDFSRPTEDNFIHLLLIDEKLGKIQATAKKTLIPKIRSLVQDGEAYEIQNVLVAHNEIRYRCTGHRWKLNMIDQTKFTKIDCNTIPVYHFEFVPFKEILESTKEDRHVDVIGRVVERDSLKEKEVLGKKSMVLDITLEDSEGNRIHCSLWDTYAIRMDAYLTVHDPNSPVIVVIHLCKLKKYYSTMGISNAFYGTKLILDDDHPVVKEFLSKIDGADVEVTQGVSQITGSMIVPLAEDMLQSRMMTIEDLIESSYQCVVIVLASIIDIEAEYSWYYDACTKCAGRIKIIAGRMFCPRCNQSRNAVPSWRNYGVKRTTDDPDLISQFSKRHNLKITIDDDEDCGEDVALTQAAVLSENVKMIEGGDSNKTELDQKECEKTPCSKSGEKRSADADVSVEVGIDILGERSINKPRKLKSVKIEKAA
ncbi:DUF223 domain protein [Medicago truncatula]|uniref:DUF223 domain protein n=1 Tax=Medicago truncatula TaxID=3880 RepID=A0A072UVW7_MEDTR|nr:DUF223 domain protein [Medicago truncatula]